MSTDPDRSQQIDRLFRTALSHEPEARTGFLDRQCAGDEELRHAVEALLEQGETVSLQSGAGSAPENAPRIGPYVIAGLLGKGGMGEVFRAHDPNLGRDVAIKTLPVLHAADQGWLARFRREARMLAALNHPNIAAIYGLEEDNGTHYLVMELVDGETLAERLAARGRLPLAEALAICAQVVEALEAANLKSIIHRDIKPANIKITLEGKVKVLDFGLAKSTSSSSPLRGEPLTLAGTEPGAIVGTPPYMSPEQVRGLPVDHRTDLWAFGCLLFELLSGRRAFEGDTASDTMAKVLEREPDWSRFPPEIPRGIRGLVERCLSKDAQLRPRSFAEVRQLLSAPSSAAWRPRRRHLFAASAVLLALAASLSYLHFRTQDRASETLAVLPFLNATGNPDSDYIGRGLCDSLIASLSQAPRLKVVSRDSVSRFAGRDQDAGKAGRELGASAVLKGRLLKRGGATSIAAELVRTSSGAVLWSGEFPQAGNSVLSIEKSLSREVLRRLDIRLSENEQRRLTSLSTSNPDAHRLYLQGRYYWSSRSEEDLKLSAESFQKAIRLDPNYAFAWSGLADAYLMLGAWSVFEPKDVYPRARAAAARTISIDGSIAEPHATLGYLKTLYEWDWHGARQEFERAIELNPNYGTAHHWYAFYFQTVGDMSRALAEIGKAREVDPLSPVISAEVGTFYTYDRQFARAGIEARKNLALDPASHYARLGLARICALQGQREEAAAQLHPIPPVDQLGAVLLMQLTFVRTSIGQKGLALEAHRALLELASRRYIMPALLARTYAALGENDKALDYFERALDDRSIVASWLRDPELDSLRSNPRFIKLFTRLGLKP